MLFFIVFLNCVCAGIITAFFAELSLGIKMLFKNNTIVNVAIDFFVYFFGALCVMKLCFSLNDGIFSVFSFVGFGLGALLLKNTCENLFAKFFDVVYNGITKLLEKFKLTKVGSKLFK